MLPCVVLFCGPGKVVATAVEYHDEDFSILPGANEVPGGCKGTSMSLKRKSDWCFCLYTGQCLDHFRCTPENLTLSECQQQSCGLTSLDIGPFTASFYNRDNHTDILTIPVPYYRDIVSLNQSCTGAEALLTVLIEDGRRVYRREVAGDTGTAPEYHCVHLPVYITVSWLHMHTFSGELPEEMLPGKPPVAVCTGGGLEPAGAAAAAHDLLAKMASAGVGPNELMVAF